MTRTIGEIFDECSTSADVSNGMVVPMSFIEAHNPELAQALKDSPDGHVEMEPRDYVCAQDFEDAIELIQLGTGCYDLACETNWIGGTVGCPPGRYRIAQVSEAGPLGKRWQDRAVVRLHEKMDRYFSGPTPPTERDAADAMLRGFTEHVQAAADALHWAAERMKAKHDGHGANTTYKAYLQVRQMVQDLTGADG